MPSHLDRIGPDAFQAAMTTSSQRSGGKGDQDRSRDGSRIGRSTAPVVPD